MKIEKLTRKIFLSVFMLLVTLMALGTSTYAWFSMNREVTVSGMEIRTVVSDNLFIGRTTIDATSHLTDTNYSNHLDYTADGVTLLEPVSTVDGKNFFYVDAANNVSANGSVVSQTYYAYNEADTSAFVAANGADGSVGYKDFVFELKAINGSDQAQDLKLTKANIVYKGIYTTEKAFRVAIFVQNLTHNADDTYGTYTMVSSATLPDASTILRKSGATYFTTDSAVSATDAVTAVNSVIDDSISISVPAGKTEYYKVVVRIWLEGEDQTCNNQTFASLNRNWALDIKFELGTNTAAIDELAADAVATTVSGLTATITLSGTTTGTISNGETPALTNAYQWYNAETGAAVDNANSYTYTATSAGKFYCKVTTLKGNVYYTDTLDLHN